MHKMPTPNGLQYTLGAYGTPQSTMHTILLMLYACCLMSFDCAITTVTATAATASTVAAATAAAAAAAPPPAAASVSVSAATAAGAAAAQLTAASGLSLAQAPQTSYSANNAVNGNLHRNINQNLIMSPIGMHNDTASGGHDEFRVAVAEAAALTAPQRSIGYPPGGTITATSTLYQQAASGNANSGSSITSFDSTNLIDDRRHQHQYQHQSHQQHQQQQQQQQHQQQHQQHLQQYQHALAASSSSSSSSLSSLSSSSSSSGSRIQAKDTASEVVRTVPMHRAMQENHLDGGAAGDGTDDVYSTPMYFGTENSTVVTTQIGATAHVPCTVHHIDNGMVSWIRKKDYHLLTVGLTTYSSDERFSATHLKHSEDWTLQIKFVQLRDAGVYECQVSTHPPTSIFLHLNVVEARAEISGPPIRYLTPGSTLRLQCRVVQNTEASEYIFWYHDNRMINYDIDRGINVSTEPDFQSSELTILRTRREHSGNFTCVASNTQPASVLVHIFKGDNPAAMYHGHVGASTKAYQTQLHILLATIAMGYRILHVYLHLKIV